MPNAQATANFTNGITGNGVVYKSGAGTLALPNARQSFLKVYNGNVRINPNGTATGTSHIDSLWLFAGTRLDLADNDLVTSATNSYYTYSQLIGVIKSGYANGNWSGPGIMSSSAAASGGHTALGVAKATDLFASFPATFSGQTVTDTDVLVKYTYYGDTNLDGQVDVTDLGKLATHWQQTATWSGGDFNYDGFVDVTDLGLLATNWQAGVANPLGPSFPDALREVGLGGVSVPEPAGSVIVGLLFSFGFSGRRRASAQ